MFDLQFQVAVRHCREVKQDLEAAGRTCGHEQTVNAWVSSRTKLGAGLPTSVDAIKTVALGHVHRPA